jgi:replicative superfamily II helicase
LNNTSEAEAKTLIEAIKAAKSKIPAIEAESHIEALEQRVVYCNTKLKAIENAKFWNIVSNDMQYYREKEKLRISKEKGLSA